MLQFWLIVLAGVLATLAMTVLMYSIHTSGLANGDMVRAIGSYITKRYDNALGPGLAVYFAGGIIFAMAYVLIFKLFNIHDPKALINVGIALGLAHGFVVSFLLIIIGEHHPLANFRQVGFGVAMTHIAGHALYGLVLGVFCSLVATQLLL